VNTTAEDDLDGATEREAIESPRDVVADLAAERAALAQQLAESQARVRKLEAERDRYRNATECYASELPDPDTEPEDTHLGRLRAKVKELEDALRQILAFVSDRERIAITGVMSFGRVEQMVREALGGPAE
jgi:chromosome segregation ATPase